MNTAHNVTWRQMNPTMGHLARPVLEVPARVAHGAAAVVAGAFAAAALLVAGGGAPQGILQRAHTAGVLLPLAVALSAWAAWRTLELAVDPAGLSVTKLGMARRVGAGVSGALHAGLAGAVGSIALGGDPAVALQAVPRLLAAPLGPPVVLLLSLGAIAGAVVEAKLALAQQNAATALPSATTLPPMDVSRMARGERRIALALSRAGALLAGVGVPLLCVGLTAAALGASKTLLELSGGAAARFAAQPAGAVLLVVTALGLCARAAHHVLLARFRIVPTGTR